VQKWNQLWLHGVLSLIIFFAFSLSSVSAQTPLTLNINSGTGTIHVGDACPSPRDSATYTSIQAGANCALSRDTLNLSAATYNEALTLDKTLIIQGAGTSETVVDAGAANRVATLSDGVTVDFRNLTLTNGSADRGGAIYTDHSTVNLHQVHVHGNIASADGGAIYTDAGSVTLIDSQVWDNQSGADGGAIYTDAGTISVERSTLYSNTATRGGGIFSDTATTRLVNSTVSGNSGSGIVLVQGFASLDHSTIADQTGRGVSNTRGKVDLRNTLIAGNSDGACAGTLNSLDYNLLQTVPGDCLLTGATDNNQTGVDPLLVALADNDGFTLTHALDEGSPAIDAGLPGSCLPTDQRGVTRPQRAICDIGAFEDPLKADLVVEKSTTTPVIMAGETLDFTVTIRNLGPETATGIHLLEAPPAEMTLVSATAERGTCNTTLGLLSCDVDTLAVNETVSITIRTQISEAATGDLTNNVTVSAAQVDPVGDNNLASATINVQRNSIIRVNTTGMAVGDDGQCSLVEAIIAANDNTPSGALAGECPAGDGIDTIELAPDTRYQLTTPFGGDYGLPILTGRTQIKGNGATIQRSTESSTPDFRLLAVGENAHVTLDDLILDNGRAVTTGGGGIQVFNGTLVGRDLFVINSQSLTGEGGGITATGSTIDLRDSQISFNQTAADDGGGLYTHSSTVTLEDVQILNNTSAGDGGGWFSYQSDINATDLVLLRNRAQRGGGWFTDSDDLLLKRGEIRENVADLSDGGGLHNQDSTIRIEDTLFQANELADGNGAGLFTYAGNIEILNSSFIRNEALPGDGGGIANQGATIHLTNSTFSENEATVGGALYSESGSYHLIHNTLVYNVAEDAAIRTLGPITLEHTLLVGNANTSANCQISDLTSAGYNLSNDASCNLNGTGDQNGLDTPMGALQDNGGAAPTHLLGRGNPAADAIPAGDCDLVTDQRGFSRPLDSDRDGNAGCDIGAVEGDTVIVIVAEPELPTATPTATHTPTPTFTPEDPVQHTVGLYKDGLWQFRDANDSGPASVIFEFGPQQTGWQPLVGDWNDDGVDGIGLYKEGLFLLRDDTSEGAVDLRFEFGPQEPGWIAVVGDWNGDDIDTVGLYKEGLFLLRDSNSSGGADHRFNFGAAVAGYYPVAGDWNGDSTDSVGLFKEGLFHLTNSLRDQPLTRGFQFGPNQSGWTPLVGDWNEDGISTIGVFQTGIWRLRDTNSQGSPNQGFNFGPANDPGWQPVASYRGGVEGLQALSIQPDIGATATATLPTITSTPTIAATAPDSTATPETVDITPSATAAESTAEVFMTPTATQMTPSATVTTEPTLTVTPTFTLVPASPTLTPEPTQVPPSATPLPSETPQPEPEVEATEDID